MQSTLASLLLAAQPVTTWDKLRAVPTQSWINLGICILAIVIVLRLWRGLKKFNDFAPWIAAGLAGSFILFYWVYERTEPPFMTPIVEKLTFFMPTKAHQQKQLEKIKDARDALKH